MPVSSRAVAAATAHSEADASREFAFSDADFRSLSALAYDQAGIVLSDSKRNLVYGRLSRRLRALGLDSFRSYREYLADSTGAEEMEHFINAISTNLTKFFRESHHFDHFRDQVAVPFSQSARGSASRRLRIWSAGCSSGEEPYTIAAVLRQAIPDIARCDVRILATDIDTNILAKAAGGEYALDSIAEVPKIYREFFRRADDDTTPVIAVDEALRSLITFRRLNLIGPWPFRGMFDAIFCRNVMIYFDNSTKQTLVDRFTAQLKPGGWLYIGHSESLLGGHPGLRLVGRTIYGRTV
jgi:chemotaxis protein methyltransferase CheR